MEAVLWELDHAATLSSNPTLNRTAFFSSCVGIFDPVLRLLGVVVIVDIEEYVGVVLLAALRLSENDIPYANLGCLLLDRMHPGIRCYSLDGMKSARVVRQDQRPHGVVVE